jgi:hypothetical protein
MLSKLAPFSGDPAEGRTFMNSFLARAQRCSDERKRYWFQQLAGPGCFSWFESTTWHSWDEMRDAFLANFTVRYKKADALRLAASPAQGAQESVVQFRARFERYLPYLDLERDYEDIVDAFVGALKPSLLSGAGVLRGTVDSWPALVKAVAQLEWNLGGVGQTSGSSAPRRQAGAHVASGEASSGKRTTRDRSPGAAERVAQFKRLCPFANSRGCWICGDANHQCRNCPGRAEFEKKHPEAKKDSGKARQM